MRNSVNLFQEHGYEYNPFLEQAIDLFKDYLSPTFIKRSLAKNPQVTLCELESLKVWMDKNSHNFYGAPDGLDPEFYFESEMNALKIKGEKSCSPRS